jgi:long-subunit acyl-CoA synthetase (AMP-forming)
MIRGETGKERENMTRIEVNTLRTSEDFKNMVASIQTEFGSRLEIRMTELVNRLLLEQEERQRSVDDIRYQLEVKEKMTLEKNKHEREEMRDRYSAMDAVVRSEFQRKDEAIMSLQTSLET